MNKIKGPSRKGRPLGRWKDKGKDYMSERGATRRGGFEQAKRECLDREGWNLFYPLGERSQRERGIRDID